MVEPALPFRTGRGPVDGVEDDGGPASRSRRTARSTKRISGRGVAGCSGSKRRSGASGRRQTVKPAFSRKAASSERKPIAYIAGLAQEVNQAFRLIPRPRRFKRPEGGPSRLTSIVCAGARLRARSMQREQDDQEAYLHVQEMVPRPYPPDQSFPAEAGPDRIVAMAKMVSMGGRFGAEYSSEMSQSVAICPADSDMSIYRASTMT